MRNLLLAIFVVGQTLILLPSQAQIVRESEQKVNNPISISSEEIPNPNTNLSDQSSTASNSSDDAKVITADSKAGVAPAVIQSNTRIPIQSRIFNHPAMRQ
ncbi:hypothetical protein [Nostoc sp. TCL26-01]|uniref:hypothetical protein n=1 Tax=Nostoc sp. TCL26-01 TaxID=2576904 RepID=UPI0015BA140C|nr:hypothetical protein [Nostoc sp. TCL26-01]QLE55868.1 hypothetical protein FD725_10240 [Nostoc sp. TCL26-01]